MSAPLLALVSDNAERPAFGRYVVTGELGRGAMGTVYRAEDPLIERKVALKVLAMDGRSSRQEEFRARFFREAKASGRLSHPNIVTVYDVGESGGMPYIAMEFVAGLTLRDELDHGVVLPIRRVVEIAIQVARGLDYAHKQGVVHRDIKPANIMLARDGTVKIMDFGIARAPDSDHTTGDAVLGSPRYMAPEQIANAELDGRTDIFALGVTLYEMLTGKLPFEGENMPSVMHAILHETPPSPRSLNPDVSGELDVIVMRALEKSPAARFARAKEMARALGTLRRRIKDGKAVPGAAGADPDRTLRVNRLPTNDQAASPLARAIPPKAGARLRAGRAGKWATSLFTVGALAIALAALLGPFDAPPGGNPADAVSLAQADAAAEDSAMAPQHDDPLLAVVAPSEPDTSAQSEFEPETETVPPATAEVSEISATSTEAPPRRAAASAPRKKAESPAAGPSRGAPKPATVVLGVLPWGEVRVNGIGRGVTPPLRDLVLPPGQYRIEIRNADFPAHVEHLTLESGGSYRVQHRFQ